jgi:hypothetical protein
VDNNTSAKRKLVSYIRENNPNIANESLSDLINGIERFVNVVQKIYIEPQANIKIIEKKIGKKITRKRVITTDLNELKKIIIDKPIKSFREVFDAFNKSVLKGKKDV